MTVQRRAEDKSVMGSDRARPYDREGRVGESRSFDELLGIGVTPTTTMDFSSFVLNERGVVAIWCG